MKKFLSFLILFLFSFFDCLSVSSSCTLERSGVAVKIEKLDQQASKKLLGGRTTIKGKNPIYPIKITFNNKTKQTWGFNPSGFNLKLASEDEVLKLLKQGKALGTIFLIVGGFGLLIYGWPCLIAMSFGFAPGVCGYGAAASVVAMGFGGAYCSKISESNSEIERSLEYTLSSIIPEGITEQVLFVKQSDLKESFNLSLFSASNCDEKIQFQCFLV